ncbi:hypothetical protein A33M_1731 [Rhodovulum sp. PH10]|uniref:hypothetical protein n=1 Tax=Rhodovulum sp. PH10 TaxID=1187851 RepID=UPI00027C24C7|nr:hypothetical protein [Rhodovulum sp. PH10]EJW12761.1 hypothetical protein A33M_1731 [Rhodovulum sp. PH10]
MITLDPAARRALGALLAEPLECTPAGWIRPGSADVLVSADVVGQLGHEGLVTLDWSGARQRLRLTPRGVSYARATTAYEADLLLAGALAGYDWLMARATAVRRRAAQ